MKTIRHVICHYDRCKAYLVTDAFAEILEALSDVRRIVVRLVGILARRSQDLLVSNLQGINANLQLHVVVRQLRLLACIARLLLEPLLAAGREGRDAAGDGVGEGAKLVHGGAGVEVDG